MAHFAIIILERHRHSHIFIYIVEIRIKRIVWCGVVWFDQLNRNWIVCWKLHNTFKVNKRWKSVDSHLVPVVKLCPKLPHTNAHTLVLYLTVSQSLMAAKWPHNIFSCCLCCCFFLDGWRCCLPEQYNVNGHKWTKQMKTKRRRRRRRFV